MKKHGWLKDSCHNLLSPQLRGIAALTACEQRQDRQGMQNSRGSHLCMFFLGSPAQVLGMFRESTSMITSRLSKIN